MKIARIILFFGIFLRIFAAVAHIETVHPDEHFQTLEPASRVVYGFGWMSWEWAVGSRSWFVPALYMPVLAFFKLIGVSGGASPIIACRLVMAGLSGWMLFRFDGLLKKSGLSERTRILTALFYCFSPSFVAWGATTLSDTWAMLFLWIALPSILNNLEDNREIRSPQSWSTGGLLLGLSFLARLQMLIWPLSFILVLIFRFRNKDRAKGLLSLLGWAVAGYSIVIAFQGVLDWFTWGSFFHSGIMNVKKNLFEDVASFYGTSPVYEYFTMLWNNLGPLFWIVLLVALVGAICFKRFSLNERDAFILVPPFFYFLIHSLIAHKETRFMLPLYPAFFYLLALGIEGAFKKFEFKIPALAFWIVLPGLSFFSIQQLYTPEHYYAYDLGELMLKVKEDGRLKNGNCLALLDHYWIWSHGELLQGQHVSFIEISSSKDFPIELKNCAYAVMPQGRDSLFQSRAGQNWQLFFVDSRGQSLFRNEAVPP